MFRSPLFRLAIPFFSLVITFSVICGTQAYNLDGNDQNANSGLVKWPTNFVFYRFHGSIDSSPVITPGGYPRPAIGAAFKEWGRHSSLVLLNGLDTEATGWTFDRQNIVSFANTEDNLADVGSALAVTFFTYNINTNELVDADIIFNVNPEYDYRFTMTGEEGAYSIQAVATHEVGHFLAIEHSGVISATMWPFLGAYGSSNSEEAMTLDFDDIAAVSQLYPAAPLPATGDIIGRVTLDGSPIYGAHVVAVRISDGIVFAGNNTLGENQDTKYGKFAIAGLPAGAYHVYAEPMDGPATWRNFSGNYVGGQYWGGVFDEGYRTTWYGGGTPTTVNVVAGTAQTITIEVSAVNPGVNPQYAAYSLDGTSFENAAFVGLVMNPGQSRNVTIIGSDIASVSSGDITCSDPTITIDTSNRQNGTVESFDFSIFRINVPAATSLGPRNLIFKRGSETAIFTGGLIVAPTPAPPENRALDMEIYE